MKICRTLTAGCMLLAAANLALTACGRDATPAQSMDKAPEPQAIPVESECAACGMVVHEQAAPRGEVLHRDGTRVFLCSLADLLRYLEVPSPHGLPVATWVEALPADADPLAPWTEKLPWLPAAEATFVVDFERAGVMGAPVLSYALAADARTAAGRLRAGTCTWPELPARLAPKARP